ncbi:hypothetical protein L2750_02905 [Shewanella submarina]|uniref:SUKH-4 immunity protein of toxin-antitoxin system n=1 Tax=Shewanella submarina TaxID=2016376 RepID=A0ABV7GG07_9GAMM|nr:hypothetical protein [Shewanella submarina]MCL1036105.1 hypothetical protein [Shewanella submarina]
MQDIVKLLNCAGVTQVWFGSRGFDVATESGLEDMQLGYSRHPDGSDLTGTGEGDWQPGWVVVARDTQLGDPFFVDTTQPQLPVYTAMHGMGSWSADEVATSLEAFLNTLSYLKTTANQADSLLGPIDSCIRDPELLATMSKKMVDLSGERYYWEELVEGYQEWLDSDDEDW